MKLFECDNCFKPAFYENTVCENCGAPLGFLSEENRLCALFRESDNLWKLAGRPDPAYRYCDNHQYDVCNWLVASGRDPFCMACELNATIPDLDNADNLRLWRKIEYAKHHLIYSLLRLKLPFSSKRQDPERGLAFDFLSDDRTHRETPVQTGHEQGLITININEADPAQREKSRERMSEPYRTLIGHFRHEIGHYYWNVLIASDPNRLEGFRAVFGDERVDYERNLNTYYAEGPPDGWQNHHVSAYSTAHPWEEWAETWAHYMHVVDSLETAYSFGLTVAPIITNAEGISTRADFDPYAIDDFDAIVDAFHPIGLAVNSINRSMGQPDLYPFIMPPDTVEKLHFIHRIIFENRTATNPS